jgi:hypothetical protein
MNKQQAMHFITHLYYVQTFLLGVGHTNHMLGKLLKHSTVPATNIVCSVLAPSILITKNSIREQSLYEFYLELISISFTVKAYKLKNLATNPVVQRIQILFFLDDG